MSTDTNTNETRPADPNDAATLAETSNDAPQAQASPADDAASAQPQQDLPPKPVVPSLAETAWNEEEVEPGDDIGNRVDGPAHHERTSSTAAEATDAAAAKRHRHRGKKKEAGQASMQDPNAAPGSTPPRAGKKQRGHAAPPSRERPAFRVGEEVFGKVVEVTDTAIFVDLSGKARAIIDRDEVSADAIPQLGDHFVGVVHGDGSRGGMVVLTNNPTRSEEAKTRIEAASTSGELVQGLITGVIKGGVEVDVQGVRSFAPGSHVELKLGADLHHLLGKRLPFKVMKYAKNGREVVLSRRELLEEENAQSRKRALSLLEPGKIVKAIVRSVVEWGVFVAIPEAENIEGLVHITEATHDRSAKLSALFHPGEEIDVKVLRIDERGKLWLSRKAASGDPWDAVAAQFAVGTRHVGRVARLQPFGAFVELAPGIDGLIRTGDLSLRRIAGPEEAVAVGDELEVVVVHLDSSQRKIGLHPAPPKDETEPAQRVAPHRVLRVAVVSAEPGGLLVRILGVTGGFARGFIPAGQTGTARGTDLRREFPAGTILEAKAIDVDTKRGECKLSIKAVKEDSEKAAFNEYRQQVARESKFGTFGDLFAKSRSNS
ncbi:MAG: 30S ribosomal protein S1 [Deltaproteobacteria bacterium]|nr:30S ribosomal protein S1 [Deltaproteobacteria bacterium]